MSGDPSYLIDTNIFLEYFLDQEDADKCEEFLRKVKTGEIEGIITVYTLHSIAVILEQTEGIESYQKFLETVVNFDGLLLQVFTPQEEIEICIVSQEEDLTFDDSYQYQAATTFDLEIVTLDSDFKSTDINSISPNQV